MQIRKVMVVATAACALTAGAALPAIASAHHAQPNVKTKQFKSTLTPKTHVHKGTVLTIKSTKAKKNTTYACVFVVLKGAANSPDLASLKDVKSSSKGHISCKQTFKPFSGAPVGSKKVSCPVSKANAKKGYKCALALATTTRTSATIGYFT